MIFRKGAHQSVKFQTFDCSSEISPNLYFYTFVLLKVYKILFTKEQRSLVILKNDSKFEKKISLLFRKWQFGEFWSKHSKVFIICTLIGTSSAKYITFGLNKYRGVIFLDTKESCKIWRKNDLWYRKWHEKFGRFSSEHMKVPKSVLSCDPFVQVENAWGKILQRSYM